MEHGAGNNGGHASFPNLTHSLAQTGASPGPKLSGLDAETAGGARLLVDLAVALVAVEHLADVVLRLVEADRREERVRPRLGREAPPELHLVGAGVVGGGGSVGIAVELL